MSDEPDDFELELLDDFDFEEIGEDGERLDEDGVTGESAGATPRKPPNRYYCAGADRRDLEGKRLCKHKAPRQWEPPCPGCGGWYDVAPVKRRKKSEGAGTREPPKKGAFKPRERIKTGIPELDRVFGGGMLEQNVFMLAGERGVGKSTLLLKAAYGTAKAGYNTLYVNGEMAEQAIYEYADRLGLLTEDGGSGGKGSIGFYCDPKGVEIKAVAADIQRRKVKVVFWDSLHVTQMAELKGDVATAQQITSCMNFLSSFAQDQKVTILIIAHLNKDGGIGGTATGEHLSDGLMRFEHYPVVDEDGDLVPGSDRLTILYLDGKSRQGDDKERAFLLRTKKGKYDATVTGDLVAVPPDLALRLVEVDKDLEEPLAEALAQASETTRLRPFRGRGRDRADDRKHKDPPVKEPPSNRTPTKRGNRTKK